MDLLVTDILMPNGLKGNVLATSSGRHKLA